MSDKVNAYLISFLTMSFLLLSAVNSNALSPLESTFTLHSPSINGSFDPFSSEWPATYVLKITDQEVDAALYIMNNRQSVFMMVDAASIPSMMDTTEEDQDHCTIYLYFNGKGIRVTVFGDNSKMCESTNSPGNPLSWSATPCPSSLHAAAGFGTSPDTPGTDHRMYEFAIPLDSIGAATGDTIYFASPSNAIDSLPFDYNGGAPLYNIWPPGANSAYLTTWGQILLADPPAVIPTINEWGVIIFALLAGVGSVYYLRRRGKAS
jgi:hypothetical protein